MTMADDLVVDMNYSIMTVNSQIIYKPTDDRNDPEPDNDHEVYVGNLPAYYTIEKFVNFAKISGSIYSVRLLKGSGGLNKGFGYIMYRHLATVDIAIKTFNESYLPESDTNRPLILQKSLRNTIMMIYGLSKKNNSNLYIRSEINYFVINHPSLLLKFECEDDTKLFLSFKSLKAAQIFKKKLKDSFNFHGVKMYYFNDTENWERWEDLKKNFSINPQGNRVRFVPIIPNNANCLDILSPTSPRSLLFKPFIPKHMGKCSSVENINLTQQTNDEENQNTIPVSSCQKSPVYSAKFNKKNNQFFGLQVSQQQQKIKDPNTSTCFVDKFKMNALGKSLPKLPLRTIWTNDNVSQNFMCTAPSKTNTLRKPFSSGLNCLPPTVQSTNYVPKSMFQHKTQVLSNSSNNSRYSKSSYLLPSYSSHKSYSIPKNTCTSVFPSDHEKISSTYGSLNIDDIWKD